MREIAAEVALSESRVSQMISGVVERARASLRARGRTRYTAFT
jgi:DNA-directed RNA polymerase specialized sigma subunit